MNSKFNVELTETAFNDLRRIRDHIAQDRPATAERFLLSMLGHIDTLELFPHRCPAVPEPELREKGYRHLIHGPYRLIFTVARETVLVLHIVHSARQTPPVTTGPRT